MVDEKRKKRSSDFNVIASQIVEEATREEPTEESATKLSEKNPAAVALGRLGGLKGGKARAKKLSKRRRKETAIKAALARWSGKS